MEAKPEVQFSVPSPSLESHSGGNGAFCSIDKRMLRFKLHFFSYIGAMGITIPYVSIIATSRVGLSGSSLGTILTFQQLLYLLVNPLIGYTTDYFNRLKGMICFLTILFALSVISLLPIPHTNINKNSNLLICSTEHLISNNSSNQTLLNSQSYSPDFLESFFISEDNQNLSKITPCNILSVDFYVLDDSYPPAYCDCNRHKEVRQSNRVYSVEQQELVKYFPSLLNWTLPYNLAVYCKNTRESYTVMCSASTSHTRSEFDTYQFWTVGILLTLLFTCVNALLTLSDTACQESVRQLGSDYGRQRLFGSFGFAIMSVVGGYLVDLTGNYIASFSVMGVLVSITLFNICGMSLDKPAFSRGILKEFKVAVRAPDFLLFLAGVLLNGAGASVTRYYLLVFLTDLGSSRSLTGLVAGMQSLIEIPFMFFSGWAIQRVGHFGVLALSLSAYCLRFLCYGCLTDPWWAVAIELFQGFTCGLFYPAATSFAKMKARPGTEATTQAVVFTAYDGFGLALGSFLFGITYDYLGGHGAFLYGSSLFGMGAVLFLVGNFFLSRRQNPAATATEYTLCDEKK